MLRRLMSAIGGPAVTAAALLLSASAVMGQHGGGSHGGGSHGGGAGHGSGGHASGWHGDGGHAGSWHGDGGRGGFYQGGRYYGGYPFGYGWGFWGGFYPGYYRDYYPYYGLGSYDYYPAYSPDYFVAPTVTNQAAPLNQIDERVMARIVVPAPDAQVWVEGQEMSPSGTTRLFYSPPLEDGSYTYTFRARWSQDGNEVDQTRRVRVHPGDRITVDFSSRPES